MGRPSIEASECKLLVEFCMPVDVVVLKLPVAIMLQRAQSVRAIDVSVWLWQISIEFFFVLKLFQIFKPSLEVVSEH